MPCPYVFNMRATGKGSNVWILVGLGNPGDRYRHTRHNLGFGAVEAFAARQQACWHDRKHIAETGEIRLGSETVLAARPLRYMNRSGEAILELFDRYGSEPGSLVVVHDDLDLPFERLKIKRGGGPGGHRGVESIILALGTDEFPRVKMGIGRPEADQRPEDYVLSRFSPGEAERVPDFLGLAADALAYLVQEGLARAMNRFNNNPDKDTD